MKFIMRVASIMLIANSVLGCDNNTKKIRDKVNSMLSQNVIFPTDLKEYAIHDSIYTKSKITGNYKIVTYFSPLLCTSCNLNRLMEWDLLKEEFPEIPFVYILSYNSEQDEEDIKSTLHEIQFLQKVFLDKGNHFHEQNSYLNFNPLFHTFMIDQNNKIILVGDPSTNDNVLQLYKRQLSLIKKLSI